MGIVLISVLFLLGISQIFSESLIFWPMYALEAVKSLSFYLIMAIGILLVGWIVGD